jgi:hypothetical protein
MRRLRIGNCSQAVGLVISTALAFIFKHIDDILRCWAIVWPTHKDDPENSPGRAPAPAQQAKLKID